MLSSRQIEALRYFAEKYDKHDQDYCIAASTILDLLNMIMPDMTTHEAAAYLAEHGYTVNRRRTGGSGPPSADTLKHWARAGKLQGARKSGDRWLIPQAELDRLIKSYVATSVAPKQDT